MTAPTVATKQLSAVIQSVLLISTFKTTTPQADYHDAGVKIHIVVQLHLAMTTPEPKDQMM